MRLTSEERAELSDLMIAEDFSQICTFIENLLAKREALVQAATLEAAAKACEGAYCKAETRCHELDAEAIRDLVSNDCLTEFIKARQRNAEICKKASGLVRAFNTAALCDLAKEIESLWRADDDT